MNDTEHRLLFEVIDSGILLWINDTVALPFKDLYEWRNFTDKMLGMIPEMKENYGVNDE